MNELQSQNENQSAHGVRIAVLAILLAVVGVTLPQLAGAQTLYGVNPGFDQDPALSTLDHTDGSVLSTIGTVLVGGETTIAARGMAMDPVGGSMYVTGPTELGWQLYAVDLTTAAATVIGGFSGHAVRDLTFDASGQLYGVTGSASSDANSLLTIDKASGASSLKVALSGNNGHSIAYDPQQPDVIFHLAMNGGSPVFETVDIATNALTSIPFSGASLNCPLGMVWDPVSSVFRFMDCEVGYYSLTKAGVATQVSSPPLPRQSGLAFDQDTTTPVELSAFSID